MQRNTGLPSIRGLVVEPQERIECRRREVPKNKRLVVRPDLEEHLVEDGRGSQKVILVNSINCICYLKNDVDLQANSINYGRYTHLHDEVTILEMILRTADCLYAMGRS